MSTYVRRPFSTSQNLHNFNTYCCYEYKIRPAANYLMLQQQILQWCLLLLSSSASFLIHLLLLNTHCPVISSASCANLLLIRKHTSHTLAPRLSSNPSTEPSSSHNQTPLLCRFTLLTHATLPCRTTASTASKTKKVRGRVWLSSSPPLGKKQLCKGVRL